LKEKERIRREREEPPPTTHPVSFRDERRRKEMDEKEMRLGL
jgi:hypothetical protein